MTSASTGVRSVQTGHLTRLDTMRAFAAFGVVLIHAPPTSTSFAQDSGWQWFAALWVALARVAVPFFFVASGYLLARGDAASLRTRWIKGARRIVLWMVVYSVAYALVPVLISLCHGTSWSDAFWFPLQLIQAPADTLLGGAWHHLWFLPHLLIGQGVVFISLRWTSSAWPPGCLAALVLVANSLQLHGLFPPDSLIGILTPSFIHVSYAIAGAAAGAWLARLKQPPSTIGLLVIGALGRLVEIACAGNVCTPRDLMEFWAGSSIFILALAAVSWSASPTKADQPSSPLRSFAAVSAGIYLLHPLFLLVLEKIPMFVGPAAPLRALLGFFAAYLASLLALRSRLTRPLVC